MRTNYYILEAIYTKYEGAEELDHYDIKVLYVDRGGYDVKIGFYSVNKKDEIHAELDSDTTFYERENLHKYRKALCKKGLNYVAGIDSDSVELFKRFKNKNSGKDKPLYKNSCYATAKGAFERIEKYIKEHNIKVENVTINEETHFYDADVYTEDMAMEEAKYEVDYETKMNRL